MGQRNALTMTAWRREFENRESALLAKLGVAGTDVQDLQLPSRAKTNRAASAIACEVKCMQTL
jgi:hypothetical protein